MRVTNQMMSRNLLRNLNRNMQAMQDYQDQLSTGKKVQDPSDGPVAVTKIVKYKSDIRALEQYDKNAKDALSFTETSELAIADTTNALDRARELAVQAANGTNTEEETKNIAKEIRQLKDHIINNGNKTFAGKYIFSGYHTDEKLLNDDGTYNFDITNVDTDQTPQTTYEVGVGEDIKVSTNGIDLFGLVQSNESAALIEQMPQGYSEGSTSKAGGLIIDEPMTQTIENEEFVINGKTYKVESPATFTTKQELLNFIKGAEDITSPTPPPPANPETLDEVANVSFNSENKIVIEADDLTQNVTSSNVNIVSGDINEYSNETLSEATVTGLSGLTDTIVGDAANKHESLKFVLDVNGTEEIVNIPDLDSIGPTDDINELVTEMNNQLSANVQVVNTSGQLKISTVGTVDDGNTIPNLNVKVIKGDKSQLMQDLDEFVSALESNNKNKMNEFIANADEHLNNLNSERSIIGAKTNRMELILSRISDDSINVTQLLSNAQDVDMSEAIMNMKNRENVYRAALSTGAKTIQPSLIDFLR